MSMLDFLRGGTPEDRFAKQVIRRLRDRGWTSEIEYDRDGFALFLGGEGGTILLRNIYRDWSQAAPARKSDELDRATSFVFEPRIDNDFDKVAAQLLPVIRSRVQMENQWLDPSLRSDRNMFEEAVKPFCEALAIAVAVDHPSAISIANDEKLSKWARPLEEVLSIAIENLRARSPSRFDRTEGGFYLSSYNDYYDASRLLLPQLFQALPLRGDPIAVAVSRAGVAVAGSEDLEALDAMAAFVEAQVAQDSRPISYLPLILRRGEWQPCDLSGPGLAALDRLRIKQSLWDYAEQKALLDGHFERIGRDLFVATLSAMEHEGRPHSWATWTCEAVSLLPEAEAIVIRRDSASPMLVRGWADIVETCGPLRLEPGMYPRRYLVERAPDDDSWRRLTACEHPAWFPTLSSNG